MRYHPPSNRLVIGAFVATLLVAGPAYPTAAAQTDDEQVRAAVERFERTWNGGDFQAWSDVLCEEIRGTTDFTESAFADMRGTTGRLVLDVTSLDILGDQATAIIQQRGDDADDIAFVREAGGWKWCEPF